MTLVRTLLTLFLSLDVVAQAAQPFRLAVSGTTGLCTNIGDPPFHWSVEFFGAAHTTEDDVENVAPWGSGRVLAVVEQRGQRSVVELRPDLTRSTLFDVPGDKLAADLVADAAGNLYIAVDELAGGGLLAIRADGTLRAEYPIFATSVDLAADQCTLFYAPVPASDRHGISRFDVCTGTPLPDFVTTGGEFVQILPDGGVLTSAPDFRQTARYDAGGTLVRTYDHEIETVALGRGGSTFFATQHCDPTVREYDLATGNLRSSVTADMDDVEHIVAYNGFTAALGALADAAAVPSLSATTLVLLGALLALVAYRRL